MSIDKIEKEIKELEEQGIKNEGSKRDLERSLETATDKQKAIEEQLAGLEQIPDLPEAVTLPVKNQLSGNRINQDRIRTMMQQLEAQEEERKENIEGLEQQIQDIQETDIPEEIDQPEKIETEKDIEGSNTLVKGNVNRKALIIFGKLISNFADREYKVTITGDKIRCLSVDPAHVCMIDIILDIERLDDIPAACLEPVTFGFPIEILQQVSSLDADTLDLTVTGEQGNNGVIGELSIDCLTCTTIDTTMMTDPKVPDLTLPAKVTLDKKGYKTCIKTLQLTKKVNDYSILSINGPVLNLSTYKDSDIKVRINKDIEGFNGEGKARALYDVGYLLSSMKDLQPMDKTELQLNDEFPVQLRSTSDIGLSARVLVAPRIEQD